MAFGGDGPWAVSVMWIVTVITFIFVVLRVYTRAWVVESYGIDDHVYNFAFVLLLCYTIMTHIAAHYGFGQNMFDIPDIKDISNAILFEAIGQTFAVVGMAVAKWSLGLFLLRLVTQTWHKVAIWVTMGCLMAASISVCFVFWLQCSPPAYLYDRTIPGGYCHINTTPVSFTLCILCVLADFFFALFPWFFLWGLQMNQREKMVIAASMSLGFIAGACGIKRTIEVPNLSSENYLKDTVGLIVWSAAEIAITMICIGIPVVRPLYKGFLEKLSSNARSTSGYKKQTRSGQRYGLKTIGGSTMPGASRLESEATDVEGDDGDTKANKQRLKEMKLGMNGPYSHSEAVGGRSVPVNESDEEILGEVYRTEMNKTGGDVEDGLGNGNIQVVETWTVDRSSPVGDRGRY
ncbi:hypothetical protein QBC40DRAFT_34878 [Triangularia verruculosa]|uniref:Rhodopsin domain-containing protein n=1 Tax=Triangularia verruculosa TaxID=2587418 RepID=A0AAN7AP99_9PEZI|nr:hypothetical protein QBC40DRAFT_34878 [Triangularia verruculosa]